MNGTSSEVISPCCGLPIPEACHLMWPNIHIELIRSPRMTEKEAGLDHTVARPIFDK